jgi:photosystem II stability/assembly factor-like uncharacterized protein
MMNDLNLPGTHGWLDLNAPVDMFEIPRCARDGSGRLLGGLRWILHLTLLLPLAPLLAQENPGGPGPIIASEGVTVRFHAREPFGQALDYLVPPDGDVLFGWNQGDSLRVGEDEADLKIHRARLSDSGEFTFLVDPGASAPVALTVLPRDGLDQWEEINLDEDLPRSAELSGVASSPDRTIVVGRRGSVMILEDEAAPLEAHAGTDADLFSVTYFDGWFYAVGSRGTLTRSQDGRVWLSQIVPTDESLYAVSADALGLVAVGRRGLILSSADGTTWIQRESGTNRHLRGVTCSDQGCVVVGSRGIILYSEDREIWEDVSDPGAPESWSTPYTWGPANLRAVTYGGGQFVAVGGKRLASSRSYGRSIPEVLTSPDGRTWSRQTYLSDFGYRKILRGITYKSHPLEPSLEGFYAVGSSGLMLYSPDGVIWWQNYYHWKGLYDVTSDTEGNLLVVGRYGTVIQGTPNPGGPSILWSTINDRPWESGLSSLHFDGTHFRGGSSFFRPTWWAGRSFDGIRWETYEGTWIGKTVWNGRAHIAILGGRLNFSKDGVNWSPIAAFPGYYNTIDFAFTGTRFIVARRQYQPALGRYDLEFWESTDGENWSLIPPRESSIDHPGSIFSMAAGNGRLVIFESRTIPGVPMANWETIASTLDDDGEWTDVPVETGGRQIRAMEYGNGHFLAVGEDGLLLSSTDGQQWRWRDSGTNIDLWNIAFGNGIWMLQGSNSTILRNASSAIPATGILVGDVRILPDGTVEFDVSGPSGQICRIDHSPNLRDWLPLSLITLGEEAETVEHVPGEGAGKRFYRVTPVGP